jgi:hypothetical protein
MNIEKVSLTLEEELVTEAREWPAHEGFRATSTARCVISSSATASPACWRSSSRNTDRSSSRSWRRSGKHGQLPARKPPGAAAPDP